MKWYNFYLKFLNKFICKYGVKLVFIANDKFESAFSDGFVISYEFREWTTRPNRGGPLAIFDSVGSVINAFGVDDKYRKIFLCKYVKSNEQFLWYESLYGGTFLKTQLPKGTILCDKVKILYEIKL